MSSKAWDLVPTLEKCKKGEEEVRFFISPGFSYDLEDEHKEVIKQMEDEYKKYGLKVIAVTKGTYLLGGTDEATMTAYVYVDNDTEPWVIEDGVVGFMANVINESWDIQEYGSVGVREVSGLVKRVM